MQVWHFLRLPIQHFSTSSSHWEKQNHIIFTSPQGECCTSCQKITYPTCLFNDNWVGMENQLRDSAEFIAEQTHTRHYISNRSRARNQRNGQDGVKAIESTSEVRGFALQVVTS